MIIILCIGDIVSGSRDPVLWLWHRRMGHHRLDPFFCGPVAIVVIAVCRVVGFPVTMGFRWI